MGRTLVISGAFAALLLLGYYFAVARPQAERREQQARQSEAQHVAEVKAKAEAAAKAKAKAEEERLAAARQAAARGAVIVRTNPAGAEVMLGALAIERGPLRLNDLKLGKYTVKVRLEGYADWTGEVVIKENEFAELNVDLVRDTGVISITSVPLGLEVEIMNNSGSSDTPTADPLTVRTPEEITLPTGTYLFNYRRPGWPDQMKTVRINRNQRVATTASFPGGDAVITSRPSGAEVWLNGQLLGTTPQTLSDQPPGTIDFELRMDRYLPATGSITLKPKGTVQLAVKLERVSPVPFGQEWTTPGAINLTLLPVAPGSFTVSLPGGAAPRITISQPFWLGRFEVTQGQWQEVMPNNPTTGKGNINPNAAVANLSWREAMEFCRRLNETQRKLGLIPEGYAYTLPTMAQWQYACLAGNGSWLDTGNLGSYAWFSGNCFATDGSKGWTDRQPAVVGRLQPNPWGFCDMIGNVNELTLDALEYSGDRFISATDPIILKLNGSLAVHAALGGSYTSISEQCSPIEIYPNQGANRSYFAGMRLALTPIPGWKPAEDEVAPASPGSESSPAVKPADKSAEFLPGIQVAMLSRALRSQFGISDSVSGAAVTAADGNSPHATLLPAGTVIQKVNGLQVLTAATAHLPLQPGKNVLLVGQQGTSRPLILMLDEAYLGDTGSADQPVLVTARNAATSPDSPGSASTMLHPATALSRDALQGTWELRAAGGITADQSGADSWWTFDGDSFSAIAFGYLGHYVLDTSRSPATIDLKIENSEGRPMAKLWPGLIELKGGRLRIAVSSPTWAEPQRPKDFENSPDGNYGVLEFTKVK